MTIAPHLPAVKPRPYVAAILSAFIPGAGQLFLGARRSGLLQLGLLVALLGVVVLARTPSSYYALYGSIVGFLALCIFSSVHATRSAGQKVALNWRWWASGFITGLLVLFLYPNLALRLSGFKLYSVPSVSMEPTIRKNDRIVVDLRSFRAKTPVRGDVIAFRRQEASGALTIVKRVIGLPGETLAGFGNSVLVNGEVLKENYANYEGLTPAEYGNWGPYEVPANSYFVMGDHRNISLDSRMPGYGFATESDLIGQPLYVLPRMNDERVDIPIR